MKSYFLIGLLAFVCLSGCKKTLISIHTSKNIPADAEGYQKFTIKAGEHYADGNGYKAIELTGQTFTVKFDSTAIYTTKDPDNQYDINKLWGFADNGAQHHEYSARIGWRWSEGALRLFAYVYNEGVVASKEITAIAIGQPVTCSINVSSGDYHFSVNGINVQLPRLAKTEKAKGYQLYPYFGGDETAPHQVNIWVK